MEIKASLRLGNIIQHSDELCTVYSLSKEWLRVTKDRHVAISYDHIKGIPLSPEILLKAGFERSKHGWFEKMPIARFTIEKSNGDAYFINSGYDADGEPNMVAIVYYFHQLQNFWLACNLGDLTIIL